MAVGDTGFLPSFYFCLVEALDFFSAERCMHV